jgi:lipoyl(octanoyl) transferase
MEPMTGVENMAWDHALVRRAARTGECVVRVYGWSRPTLSFGRNEHAVRRSDIDAVRRPTGGRAVLHHRELTYSFTLPATDRPRVVYERLNAILVAALGRLGATVTTVERGAGAPATTGPCFAAPSAGELVYEGRKLAGSAQWRENGAVLQHGSILVDNDQKGLRPATLREVLGRAPEASELADAFAEIVGAEPLAIDAPLRDEALALCRHYADDAWTWRR